MTVCQSNHDTFKNRGGFRSYHLNKLLSLGTHSTNNLTFYNFSKSTFFASICRLGVIEETIKKISTTKKKHI